MRLFKKCLKCYNNIHMKRKIFLTPLIYLYAGIVFLIAVYFVFPQFNFVPHPQNLIFGFLIFTLGLWLMLWAWISFKRRNTPENFSRSTYLVKDGPYKFSRNPMYLGMVLMLLGLAVCFRNILGIIAPILFFLIMHLMFIPYEEKKNKATFGKDFLDYKKNARKWM